MKSLALVSTALTAAVALCSGCARNSDDAFVASARELHPAVVLLTMNVPADKKGQPSVEAYGSGVVVASGVWGSDVLTVQHVIDQASDLHVTVDNKIEVAANVIAQDEDLDLALVRTRQPNLPTAKLGSSSDLADSLGRVVGLLGYPVPDDFDRNDLGLATTIVAGRLSSLRKDAIEVSMPIVPGESGSPIFLADTGEIFGLADSTFDDAPSIGIAVPIDDARRFLHQYDAEHGF